MGELAPKLALAITAELQGDLDRAIKTDELVSGVDRNFVTAAFVLARCLAQSNPEAAAEAYERVPATSISYVLALMSKVNMLLGPNPEAAGFELMPPDSRAHRQRSALREEAARSGVPGCVDTVCADGQVGERSKGDRRGGDDASAGCVGRRSSVRAPSSRTMPELTRLLAPRWLIRRPLQDFELLLLAVGSYSGRDAGYAPPARERSGCGRQRAE